MFLVRLVYASRVNDSLSTDDVAQILEHSRSNNRNNDISGLLCFNNEYFLQCLEGSRARVNALYQRILSDKRHQDILLLSYGEITERNFGRWSMGYIPASSIIRETTMRFSGKGDFNPYEMTGDSAHALLVELARNIPTLE
ncbi:blue light sensor protein [Pseudoalteromonas ruthenica]|uniref:BLUF domain-containing protein n=1 Tax=Pseudoalteromonas ruthenica TaxID=151081 RepID=UPI001109CE8D|nr:BLUF domain-containing protein [Pseudoalteromonas ruthenica]TLX51432.1 blue light sensor protein [Pseudoalteromonas ruthenica]